MLGHYSMLTFHISLFEFVLTNSKHDLVLPQFQEEAPELTLITETAAIEIKPIYHRSSEDTTPSSNSNGLLSLTPGLSLSDAAERRYRRGKLTTPSAADTPASTGLCFLK